MANLGLMIYLIVINFIIFKNYKTKLLKTYVLMGSFVCIYVVLGTIINVLQNNFNISKDPWFFVWMQCSLIYPFVIICIITIIIKIRQIIKRRKNRLLETSKNSIRE